MRRPSNFAHRRWAVSPLDPWPGLRRQDSEDSLRRRLQAEPQILAGERLAAQCQLPSPLIEVRGRQKKPDWAWPKRWNRRTPESCRRTVMLGAGSASPPEAQRGRIASEGDRPPKQERIHTRVLLPSIALPPAGWAPPLPHWLNGLNRPSDLAAGSRATEHPAPTGALGPDRENSSMVSTAWAKMPLPLDGTPNTTSVRQALREPIARMAGVQPEGASRKLPTHWACTREEKVSEGVDNVVDNVPIGTFSGPDGRTRNQRLTDGERRGTVA